MYIETIQLYEDRKDVTLTAYILDDSAEMLQGRKRPAILICPGGAYLNCSDREAEPVALRFTAMGYHAFVLRYSTYLEGGYEIPDVETAKAKEHCQFPKPMLEIGKAMLLIREHSESWLVDTEQIAVCGFSAGAHNCAMYSVYWNSEYFKNYFAIDVKVFRPAAIILSYPLTDYIYMKETALQEMEPEMRSFFELSNLAFTGKRILAEEMSERISPILRIGNQTPPTFIWATAEDDMVPVEHTYRMASALAKAGIPHEIHVFEQGPHGMGLADKTSAGRKEDINPIVAQWISFAEKFLDRHIKYPI